MSPKHFWYSLAVVLVVQFSLVFAGIWYTNREVMKANQEWCDLLITLDNPIPPQSTSARAVDAAIKLHNLRIRFGC